MAFDTGKSKELTDEFPRTLRTRSRRRAAVRSVVARRSRTAMNGDDGRAMSDQSNRLAAPGIHAIVLGLHLPAGAIGPEAVESDVRVFLVEHANGYVLIDTGLAADPSPIGDRLAELNAGWADVSDILLTHGHPDHTGGLPLVRELAPAATVWGSPDDRYAGATSPLYDSARVRGLEVVSLPGHTPGHVGFVETTTGAVFAGDAVGSADGRLLLAPAMFTVDAAQAARSLQRLATVVTNRLILNHGAEVEDPRRALLELIARTI